MQDVVLQRFRKFKEMFVSSNIPNTVLLDLMESFITTSDNDDIPITEIPIPDGQLSLFDTVEEMK